MNTIDKYACIYRFDSNIIKCSSMKQKLKNLMSKIIKISLESTNTNDLIKNLLIK